MGHKKEEKLSICRMSAEFIDGMCSLMAPNEASSAAPYPTAAMLEAHSRYGSLSMNARFHVNLQFFKVEEIALC